MYSTRQLPPGAGYRIQSGTTRVSYPSAQDVGRASATSRMRSQKDPAHQLLRASASDQNKISDRRPARQGLRASATSRSRIWDRGARASATPRISYLSAQDVGRASANPGSGYKESRASATSRVSFPSDQDIGWERQVLHASATRQLRT